MINTQGQRMARKLLRAVYRDYALTILPVKLLDGVIAFFLAAIVTSIVSMEATFPIVLGISPDLWLPLLLGLMIFLWRFVHSVSTYKVHKVEQDVPDLDEVLSIARDTMHEETDIAEAFRADLINKAIKADTSSLMKNKAIINRMVIVFICVAIFLFAPLYGAVLTFIPQQLPAIPWLSQNASEPVDILGTEPVELQDASSIYGEADFIEPGESTLSLTVDRGLGGGDLTSPMAWQNSLSAESLDSSSIGVVVDTPAIEQLPVEFGLAKAYNLRIKTLQ